MKNTILAFVGVVTNKPECLTAMRLGCYLAIRQLVGDNTNKGKR